MRLPSTALRTAWLSFGGTLLLLFPRAGWTQDDGEPLPTELVTIEKKFDARLAEAEPVGTRPSLPPIDTSLVPQTYEAIPVETDIAYSPPSIRPLAVRSEEQPPTYEGLVRLGAGFPLGWLGDLGYASRSDAFAFRADAHTYGIQRSETDEPRYAEVDATVGGTFYTEAGVAVDADLDYDRRMYRYYGYEAATGDTTGLPVDRLDQAFSQFGLRAAVRNSNENSAGIDYRVGIDLDFLSDAFSTKERNGLLNVFARRDFGDFWYAEAEVDVDITSYDATEKQDLNNYGFTPTVGAHYDQFGVRLGATVANTDDEFLVFPQAEISYVIGGGFVAVAGVDGGLKKNNLSNVSRYMPYVAEDFELRNSRVYRGYAGLQGQTIGINYRATVSYSRINDLAIYGLDSSGYRFTTAYDSANVIGIKLEASAPLTDRVTGGLLVENRIFTLENANKPYLLPSFDASFNARYEAVPGKVYVEASLTAQNALPYVVEVTTEGPREERTEALLDLSLAADFAINERLSAFAQANNILNNRREKFPYYPTVGINVLGGIVAKF